MGSHQKIKSPKAGTLSKQGGEGSDQRGSMSQAAYLVLGTHTTHNTLSTMGVRSKSFKFQILQNLDVTFKSFLWYTVYLSLIFELVSNFRQILPSNKQAIKGSRGSLFFGTLN